MSEVIVETASAARVSLSFRRRLMIWLLILVGISISSGKAAVQTLAYVVIERFGTVAVIDTATNTLVDEIEIGQYPHGVTIMPDGTRAWVGNGRDGIVEFDTSTHEVTGSIPISGQPRFIVFTPDGTRGYVTSYTNSIVSVIDMPTRQVIQSISVAIWPYRLATTPDGRRLYVVHQNTSMVSVIDTASNVCVGTVQVGWSPSDVTIIPDGTRAYVASHPGRSVSVIDTATNRVIKTLVLGPPTGPDLPFGITTTPDGSHVWVTVPGPNRIDLIDTESNTVTGSIYGVLRGMFIAFTPDGNRAYVTNTDYSFVSVIDTTTLTVIDTVSVDDRPAGVTITPYVDTDSDSIPDDADNCPEDQNAGQSNIDGDEFGDLCDVCPADPLDQCDPSGSTAEEIPADEGGTIQTPDGNLTIDVDPGDLAEDTTISVTQTVRQDPDVDVTIGSNPGRGQAVAVYDLEPDGLAFENPVMLTITADVSSLNAAQWGRIDLYLFSDTDGDTVPDSFVPLEAACNVTDGPPFIATCSALVYHFSLFGMIAPLDSDNDGVPDQFDDLLDLCVLGSMDVNGFLPPMAALVPESAAEIPIPEKAFKQGRTLPLKLQLMCGGVSQTNSNLGPPEIFALTWTGGALELPTADLDSGDSNDSSVFFRYSDPNWVYNLTTKDLEVGTYELIIKTPRDCVTSQSSC